MHFNVLCDKHLYLTYFYKHLGVKGIAFFYSLDKKVKWWLGIFVF